MRLLFGASTLPSIKSTPSPIPLSEAMVLGSVKHPQKFGGFYDADSNGITSSCGVAAAIDAVAGLDEAIRNKQCIMGTEVFPILNHPITGGCPHCKKTEVVVLMGLQIVLVLLDRVGSIIMHLNDDHYWSRPQQAEWVKSVEDSLQPQPEEAPCALQTAQA